MSTLLGYVNCQKLDIMEFEAFIVKNDQQYECGDCTTKCKGVGINLHIKYNKAGKSNCDKKLFFSDCKYNIVILKANPYIVYHHGITRLW